MHQSADSSAQRRWQIRHNSPITGADVQSVASILCWHIHEVLAHDIPAVSLRPCQWWRKKTQQSSSVKGGFMNDWFVRLDELISNKSAARACVSNEDKEPRYEPGIKNVYRKNQKHICHWQTHPASQVMRRNVKHDSCLFHLTDFERTTSPAPYISSFTCQPII